MDTKSRPIAELVADLDRRIAAHPAVGPALFDKMTEAERERGLLHGARPICPFLRPYFLSRQRYAAVALAAETLAAAFERIAERALSDARMMELLGVTEREARLARIDPGYRALCVSSRLDAFLTETGFQFLEYNAESPAGIGDQMVLDEVLGMVPHVREFLEENDGWSPEPHRRLLGAMLDAYREWGGTHDRPRIAVVDWAGVPTESEFAILARFFESEGYPTVIADPRDLEYRNGVLEAGGARVDILYKRIIIHELLATCDDSHPLLRAYADRAVCLANSFRVKLVHKKASFAILTDPEFEGLFTAEQLAVIREHIPWTRVVRPGATDFEGRERDMRELLSSEREKLVLKPNDDYGGHNVWVGHATAPGDWTAAVDEAFRGTYVAQRCLPVHRESMPLVEHGRLVARDLTIDFDPFLFNNSVEGGLVRLSSTALSNVSSGGSETALCVLP